jgi:hypothetical protein
VCGASKDSLEAACSPCESRKRKQRAGGEGYSSAFNNGALLNSALKIEIRWRDAARVQLDRDGGPRLRACVFVGNGRYAISLPFRARAEAASVSARAQALAHHASLRGSVGPCPHPRSSAVGSSAVPARHCAVDPDPDGSYNCLLVKPVDEPRFFLNETDRSATTDRPHCITRSAVALGSRLRVIATHVRVLHSNKCSSSYSAPPYLRPRPLCAGRVRCFQGFIGSRV